MRGTVLLLLVLIQLWCIQFAIAINYYKQGDSVPVYFNKIFSLQNPLAYSYSHLSFVCPTQQDARRKSWLVFDQDLRGVRPVQSDYKINFLENQECKLLCKQSLSIADVIQVEELIADEYLAEWELDGMPGATVSYTNEAPEHNYRIGFPLGFRKGDDTFINNHVIFQILYTTNANADSFAKYSIVGFEIYPDSIAEGECTKKNIEYEYQQVTGRRTSIVFTYSVQWKEIKQFNTNRWDAFLLKPNPDRHYYSLLNGIIVVLLVSGVLIVIFFKTMVHNVKENVSTEDKIYDDADDFIGWRLINRDVFRRPVYGGLLTPVMGSGIQLITVAVGLIACLQLGWYHPAQPGSLTRLFTLFFLLGNVPAGYWSARIYKVFRGKSWRLNSILTATVVPSGAIILLFASSMITWTQQSSLAISFYGWISLFAIWIFSVALTCIGAYFGDKTDRIEYPARTTQISRLIPTKRWYQANLIRTVLAGIIPFAIAFLNWHEFLISISKGEYILSIPHTVYVSILLLVSSAQMTIVLVFLQLCSEDYLWWWQAFMIGASPACYLFAYGFFYYWQTSKIEGMVGASIYMVNLMLGCGLLGLCTGTLGFLSTYVVIRRMYSTVKVD